jgi:hypothetical protein
LARKIALGLALAAACLAVQSTTSAARGAVENSTCGEAAYSYAGIAGRRSARGIAATLELTTPPRISHGHVAAWIGVGGVGLGPSGTNSWLQVGLAATETVGTALYYEVARPRLEPRYVRLSHAVSVGQRHRVGVIEMRRRAGWWRVWLDGSPVSAPIHLPASHDRWAPVATTESWNGGVTSCNSFAYRFTNIRAMLDQTPWRPLKDAYAIETPGYRVTRRPTASLVAVGGLGAPSPVSTLPSLAVAPDDAPDAPAASPE